jgi:ATP-dependent helicase HrpB
MTIPLPVDAVLPELVRALRVERRVVLRAPTGAGKTTRVPAAILDASLGSVVVLEPRRLAARAAARRVAEERGTRLSGEVGYQVRFENKTTEATRLRFVTEGILLRRFQDDPYLAGVGCLVFDEFHERNLDGDLALAMARRVQREARPELAIVVMSATLDVERVSSWLGDAPRIESEGRSFPVEVRHRPARGREPLEDRVLEGVQEALAMTTGDALVFLPGVGEIRRARERLEPSARQVGYDIVELYGDLPPERQDAALRAGARRRVVLATNVAESSVTVEGVTSVVDSGLERSLRHDPSVGLDRLELGAISRASADQRAGRAGRSAPGVCLRLWSEMEHRALVPYDEPEVRRVDLAAAVLQLLVWGEREPSAFPWFEAPRPEALERALVLLEILEARDARGATELGRTLARLPLHPRLARLLVEGWRAGDEERAALAAAMLSERDPFERRPRSARSGPRAASDSDVLDRVIALEGFDRAGSTGSGALTLHEGGARTVLRARDQYLALAREHLGQAPRRELARDEALLRALFAAFPDRLARRRERRSDRGRMVGGRGVRLADTSAVTEPELFVCVDLDAGANEAFVRQASIVEREWISHERLVERVETTFDEERGRVVAKKVSCFADLVLEEHPHPVVDAELAERLLLEAALRSPARALKLERPECAAFLARLAFLRAAMPELELPEIDEPRLRELLAALVPGRRSLEELALTPVLEALQALLTPAQRRALEREAPDRIHVPSGSHVRLDYASGRVPVLAARIQELFGMRATPRLAAGRVAILVHLLAPNGRPQQVTDDLESFWKSTYSRVRKELRARYPKHAWPEDPLTATPERKPRRRPQ